MTFASAGQPAGFPALEARFFQAHAPKRCIRHTFAARKPGCFRFPFDGKPRNP
jgi:hypothetical protein